MGKERQKRQEKAQVTPLPKGKEWAEDEIKRKTVGEMSTRGRGMENEAFFNVMLHQQQQQHQQLVMMLSQQSQVMIKMLEKMGK